MTFVTVLLNDSLSSSRYRQTRTMRLIISKLSHLHNLHKLPQRQCLDFIFSRQPLSLDAIYYYFYYKRYLYLYKNQLKIITKLVFLQTLTKKKLFSFKTYSIFMVLGLCKIAIRNINSTILISHSKSSQYLDLNKSGYKKIRGKACNSSTSYLFILYIIMYQNLQFKPNCTLVPSRSKPKVLTLALPSPTC